METAASAGTIQTVVPAVKRGRFSVNLATNVARTGASSEQGDYSFPSLMAGEYEVSSLKNGCSVPWA